MHPASEQIWLVEQGNALLKMADGQTDEWGAGDVVRTPAGMIHGATNTGGEPFVYLAVTTPPEDFSLAYKGRRRSSWP
jgi:mannose-6-phosphate isomerase-like protein (cupin superfamily)